MVGSDEETAVDPLPTARPAGELTPGTVLNGIYRIEERLGAGGMGEVYRASNIGNDDEQDAIKIIGRGRADQAQIESMFRKEARVLSRIRSPAVTKLKLFARDPDLNLLYFVTDYVAGESLLDRLKRQPATPEELRALLRRVLTGLQAAHEAGAIHRDLSPDNIILPDGKVAEAKLIDFGIVKELDPNYTTMIGDSFAGKLGYIAPEQLGFSGSEVGPWTDLYSLGLVGVAFAAGRPLDMGGTVGRADEARREPIDLSAVPEDLRPLFTQLLAYDRRQRPQSADAALAILDDDLAAPGEGGWADAGSRWARTGHDRVSRTRFERLAAVAMVVAILAFASVLLVRRSPSKGALDPVASNGRSDCSKASDTVEATFLLRAVALTADGLRMLRRAVDHWMQRPAPAADVIMYVQQPTAELSKLEGNSARVANVNKSHRDTRAIPPNGRRGESDSALADQRLNLIRQLLLFGGSSNARVQTRTMMSDEEPTHVAIIFGGAGGNAPIENADPQSPRASR